MDEPLYKMHESLSDMKKRTFKAKINAVKTMLYGYRMLKYPYYYIFLFKPILVGVVPKKNMLIYHRWYFKRLAKGKRS